MAKKSYQEISESLNSVIAELTSINPNELVEKVEVSSIAGQLADIEARVRKFRESLKDRLI